MQGKKLLLADQQKDSQVGHPNLDCGDSLAPSSVIGLSQTCEGHLAAPPVSYRLFYHPWRESESIGVGLHFRWDEDCLLGVRVDGVVVVREAALSGTAAGAILATLTLCRLDLLPVRVETPIDYSFTIFLS